jgi:hypothetical protein
MSEGNNEISIKKRLGALFLLLGAGSPVATGIGTYMGATTDLDARFAEIRLERAKDYATKAELKEIADAQRETTKALDKVATQLAYIKGRLRVPHEYEDATAEQVKSRKNGS